MTVTITLRQAWIFRFDRLGQVLLRGRYKAAEMAMFAAARQTLTAMIPIARTRCFITASMIDSAATAKSATANALTGCWATRFTSPRLAAQLDYFSTI